jgi:hypothetical protein
MRKRLQRFAACPLLGYESNLPLAVDSLADLAMQSGSCGTASRLPPNDREERTIRRPLSVQSETGGRMLMQRAHGIVEGVRPVTGPKCDFWPPVIISKQ